MPISCVFPVRKNEHLNSMCRGNPTTTQGMSSDLNPDFDYLKVSGAITLGFITILVAWFKVMTYIIGNGHGQFMNTEGTCSLHARSSFFTNNTKLAPLASKTFLSEYSFRTNLWYISPITIYWATKASGPNTTRGNFLQKEFLSRQL